MTAAPLASPAVPPRSRSLPRRRAGLVLALVAALAAVAGLPAPPAVAATVDAVVDLTYPAERGTRYSNDYTQPRGGGTRMHCATDIIGPKHSEVYAAVGGTITFMPTTKPSYGYMITIAGDDGRRYSYVHLNDDTPGTRDASAGPQHAYAPGLRQGMRVARGQHIGWMGDSGNAKGTVDHLHFEVHDPAVRNPPCETGGIHRINPIHSLRAAEARGDYGGTGRPAPPPAPSPAPPAPAPAGVRGIALACPADRVAKRYHDVAGTHRPAVDCVSWWRIAEGRADGTFGAVASISRAQMASFAVRLAEAAGRPLPRAARDHFDDDAGSVHQDAINRVAAAGIMGSADRRFSPDLAVTRGSMTTIVARTYRHLAGGRDLPAGTTRFRDVRGHVHEASIGRVAGVGIAAGMADGSFRPDAAVTREQMATFLARLLDLSVAEGRARLPR
jgi:murein DD-endopeptidase MepM/ murein hydrolase activator NlpD